jgi:ankyrin repeat protein
VRDHAPQTFKNVTGIYKPVKLKKLDVATCCTLDNTFLIEKYKCCLMINIIIMTEYLFDICSKGDNDKLLQYIRSKKSLNVKHKLTGFTPLMEACFNGNDKCVALLIAANVSLEIQGMFCFTALHIACRTGNKKCVSLLVEGGCNTDIDEIEQIDGYDNILRKACKKKINVLNKYISIDVINNILMKYYCSANMYENNRRYNTLVAPIKNYLTDAIINDIVLWYLFDDL